MSYFKLREINDATIGEGSVIQSFCLIQPDVKIGIFFPVMIMFRLGMMLLLMIMSILIQMVKSVLAQDNIVYLQYK